MKLTLGFSPCPNDTFIFDALIHHKIDTEGLDFEVYFDDVETLNQKAVNHELDITKLSFHAFAHVADKYALLDSGSALGFGVGPLLICKDESLLNLKTLAAKGEGLRIGIPGKLTTANFLLGIAFPEMQHKEIMVFSEIEDALLEDRIDVGLIIHENRFTYTSRGLHKILDLGSHWESLTGCAIPLGGIVISRNLDKEIQLKVNRLIRKSVEFAFANPKSGIDFISAHAQAMDQEVMYKHIDLYVNNYSIDLGEEGRKAINILFEKAEATGLIQAVPASLYVNSDTV
ncbi:1,4-dihydroxy-6-naphthoate synthase [Pedobacter antarcticus]|uniref:menaquinone biosynthesis family protein n=1 Tax=Pedobacter antarcticus TaxID=34086 RepID=UPI00292E8384|nr:1,4-dihydroxy-6-naphthoate synthase [Pedobacter antarcticus]